MRTELKKMNGKRLRFNARVERFGMKNGWGGRIETTILLRDVRFEDTNKLATDHLWFTFGAWAKGISTGAAISFDARVDVYIKGYFGGKADKLGLSSCEIDYKLTRPTKVVIQQSLAA